VVQHFVGEQQRHDPRRKDLPFRRANAKHAWRGFAAGELTVANDQGADGAVVATFTPHLLPLPVKAITKVFGPNAGAEQAAVPVTVAALRECPHHGRPLVPAGHHAQGALRRSDPELYGCACRGRPTMATMPRSDEEAARACTVAAFLVCPDPHCNFAICDACYGADAGAAGAAMRKAAAIAAAGNAARGLEFQLAQILYLPCVQWCAVVLLCKFPIACSFRGCYNPAEVGFLVLAGISAVVLVMFGLGLLPLLYFGMMKRKRMIIEGHLAETAEGGAAEDRAAVTTPQLMVMNLPHRAWAAITKYDTSRAKGFYAPYEFRYMLFIGPLLLFKAGQVLALLLLRPDSVEQLVAAASLELVQFVIYAVTEPFADPWMDLLAKAGFSHQVGQLGLMLVHRGSVMSDPLARGAAPFLMVGLGVAYVLFVGGFVAKKVVAPFAAAKRAEKATDAEFEAEHKQRLDEAYGSVPAADDEPEGIDVIST
jgi:hypothetical protein